MTKLSDPNVAWIENTLATNALISLVCGCFDLYSKCSAGNQIYRYELPFKRDGLILHSRLRESICRAPLNGYHRCRFNKVDPTDKGHLSGFLFPLLVVYRAQGVQPKPHMRLHKSS